MKGLCVIPPLPEQYEEAKKLGLDLDDWHDFLEYHDLEEPWLV